MQFQSFVFATALAASASATPLFGRQVYGEAPASYAPVSEYTYAPTPTRPAAISASPVSAPAASGSFAPAQVFNDGYGDVAPGNFSLVFCPVEHSVTVNRWGPSGPSADKVVLACPDGGSTYETVSSSLLPSYMSLNVHGGNLCTSNTAQYYLWPSRMYENLWLAYGLMPVDVPADSHCEMPNGGEVARCVIPLYSSNYSPSRQQPIPSHVSAIPSHVSGGASVRVTSPADASRIPQYSPVPPQYTEVSYSAEPTITPASY